MSKVTRLQVFAGADAPVRHALNRLVLEHWQTLRGVQPVPAKDALGLKTLARALPWLGLVEMQPEKGKAVLRWRLAGSGLCRIWKRELKGSRVLDGWPQFERRTLLRMLERTRKTARPFVARLKFPESGHGSGLRFEAMCLPVMAGKETLLLFTLVPESADIRLDFIHHGRIELQSLRSLPLALHGRDAIAPGDRTFGHARTPGKAGLRVIPGGLE